MKTHHHIIAYSALSLTIAVLLAVILWPTEQEPLPIDPDVYRTEERMRLRALEVAPLERENDSLVKLLNERPKQSQAKRKKVAQIRMSMSDSAQAELLHERLR
jgi:hypothetical protein